MSITEFFDWWEFSVFHPFPADIIDRQGSQQLAMLGNINRAQTTPAFHPRDFYVLRDPPPPQPVVEPAATPQPARPTLSIAQRMRSVIREV
jgi:hypothetical protein